MRSSSNRKDGADNARAQNPCNPETYLAMRPSERSEIADSAAGHWDDSSTKELAGQTREWRDAAGNLHELPNSIERVMPSDPMSEAFLRVLCPEKLASRLGMRGEVSEEQQHYLRGMYARKGVDIDLPLSPIFRSPDFPGAVEDLSPDLVLRIPRVVWAPPAPAGSLTAPVIEVPPKLSVPDMFLVLGNLFDVEDRAEALADYIDRIYVLLQRCRKKISDAEIKRIYVGRGGDEEHGLWCMGAGTYHDGIADVAGAHVICDEEAFWQAAQLQDGGVLDEAEIERIRQFDPEYLFFTDAGYFHTTIEEGKRADGEAWRNFPAFCEHRAFCVPRALYSWMEPPFLFAQIIGVLWLGNLLHPNIYDYDIYAEVKEFYRLFLGYEFGRDLGDLGSVSADEEISHLLSWGR